MSNDPLVGQKLGDYQILGLLGQGGMARVYRGYDETLDRYAAVKVIEPNLVASEDEQEYQERFVREARSIARLNHPRVVSVFQFGQNEEKTLFYMAMNFIEGRDLREILKEYNRQNQRMSNAQVLQIIRDVAEALDYAHKQGVIHRDVKPSNIMVTSDGHGVLTDFGLALNAQEGTIGNTFGSVHYIAPEQAVSSAQAVPQSDLYSLGVVLFEMMTGRVPFEDVSAMSVALKHISDPPPLPSTINTNISTQVEEVIIKALDKDPKKRFTSGMAFVHALEGAFAVSDDEDTHDLENSQENGNTDVVGAVGTAAVSDATSKSVNRTTAEDDIPTINDSKGSRPSAQQISDALNKAQDDRATRSSSSTSKINVAAILNEEDRKQRRGIFAVVGALAIVLLLAGALFASGVFSSGDDGDDEPPSTTSVAASNGGEETEEPLISGVDPSEETEEATEAVDPDDSDTSVDTEITEEATEETTEEPVSTDEVDPTATSEPTETPEPTVTEEPTDTPEPPEVRLSYDGRTLVLQNIASRRINVSQLRFVPINENGSEGRSFTASEWDVSDINRLRSEDCLMVWTLTFVELPSPDFCNFRQGMFSTSRSFWLASGSRETFEVRLGDTVLATCAIVPRNDEFDISDPFAETCEFRLDASN